MGTKNNPGQFDCHAKAEPDEPLFTLLARDKAAPHLVRLWAAYRGGNVLAGPRIFAELHEALTETFNVTDADFEKAVEANNCANAMIEWREDRK